MLRIALAVTLMLFAVPVHATEAGWALLRNGGQIVLLRHANAPGAGDPANFDIENCRTQRNLSERGRLQARRIGALFAARAEPVEHVYSSRFCRSRETARLAFGDSLVEEIEALDSLAHEPDKEEERTKAVMELIRDYSGSGNLVFVTDEENITALTGSRAREGEAIIVTPNDGGLHITGRIVFN
ncbi:histidine phosphatase family protein [Aquamicrobium sp. LC103]|uniref:histidine phosphatase family protein n=1 Tax=Aquamicrobium sp. LC103 TaxID=1120658 RepID=UPI00063EA75C|nr:histidine phosphatase family protein [Aquamicrobium sp. LC103]TKT79119.1 histidine phosphatase family protein [Aquamicrobium sp. LC103]